MARALETTRQIEGADVEAHYGRSPAAWGDFDTMLRRLAERPELRRICEIGGGANPAFSLDFVREHDLQYTVLDISQEELDKAPEGYHKVCADITAGELSPVGAFDLVFSKMLAEHVGDARRFHRNVHDLLVPGGLAVHFFPTLYSPPFVVNRMLPERVAERVVESLQRERDFEGRHGKFPAHYQWCRGPTSRQVRRFQSVGFDVVEYHGFYGTRAYYRRVKALQRADDWLSKKLVRHPIPWLTSFAWVVLRRRR